MSVFTGAWWKAATMRALRTAAVVALPYVPLALNGQDYLLLLGAAAMGAFLSYLTSLTGLPEAEGEGRPWFYSLFARTGKTVAQALLTAVGAVTFVQDVDWSSVLPLVVSAAVGSILLWFTKGAPETSPPASVGGTPVVAAIAAPPVGAEQVVESPAQEEEAAVEAAPVEDFENDPAVDSDFR